MKFTVEQSALTDGVNWVSRSLSTRPIKTELLGIVIDATGDEVFLSASDLETASKAHFVAEVKEFYSGVSKNEKKTKYVRMKVSDETANLTVLMFNDKIDNNKLLNNNKNFDENNVFIFKGIKKDDCVFVDLAAIQDHQIYMKLSEIKNIAKNI